MPSAVRDAAHPSARAFGRGARPVNPGGGGSGRGTVAADPAHRPDQPDVPTACATRAMDPAPATDQVELGTLGGRPSLVGISTVQAFVRPLVHGSGSRRRVALPERQQLDDGLPVAASGAEHEAERPRRRRSLTKRDIRLQESGEVGPVESLVGATLKQRAIDALALELSSLALRRDPRRGPSIQTLDLLPPHPGIDQDRDAPSAAAGRRQRPIPRRPTAGPRTPPRTPRG